MKSFIPALAILIFLSACKKKESSTTDNEPVSTNGAIPVACPSCDFPDSVWTDVSTEPKLVFKFKFDSTQVRLNNFGTQSTVTPGNAAQSPKFNNISAHYIEMAADDFTPLGQGTVLYEAEETDCGGSRAIVFCESILSKEGDVFFSIPLSKIAAGSYKWLRVSLAYQNYDIKIRNKDVGQINGTIASFVGFNTYVSKYKMKNAVMTSSLNPGTNKTQGYWGFYTKIFSTEFKSEGQAPQTTVVNPNSSSPIPAGSCVVTGEFFSSTASGVQPLVITGSETQDILITVSLSTNKSFEWKEVTFDGLFQPEIGETVVDMGLRGMIPKY